MGRIIKVKGYKAFTGTMRVLWADKPAEELYGDWLYTPDTNSWHHMDRTFPANICMILRAQ